VTNTTENASTNAGSALLSGLRVIEVADFVAAPMAGKIFADLGADVIKIEPPAGDSARRAGPFPNHIPHREASALFLQYNTNKRSLRLDLHARTGRRLLDVLLDDADVLLIDLAPAALRRHDIDLTALRAARPRLIVASLSPHGLSGPLADAPSTPLIRAHRGGAAQVLARSVTATPDAERRPTSNGAHVNEADGGVLCALSTIAALIDRERSGEGQLVEVAAQEAITSLDRVELSLNFNDASGINSSSSGGGFGGRLQTSDGYIISVTLHTHQWAGMVKTMGDPDWAFDSDGELKSRVDHGPELQQHFAAWTRDRSSDAIYHDAQANGVPVGPVLTPNELLHSEHERVRGFFEDLPLQLDSDHPPLTLPYPRFPSRFSAAPIADRRPAPRLGQHTRAILDPLLGRLKQDGQGTWSAAQARRAGIA
jgi:crotonobetainyl-CoA:carnitine CoA-transferase CaiB-like acyl-CoA transferase